MVVVGVLVAGSIVGYLVRMQVVAEEKLAKQADEEYGKGEHAAAQKTFEKLLAEYPDSEESPRYRFFADRADASRCPRGDDPREPGCGHRAAQAVPHRPEESEFSKPKSGFGSDILEAGRKLGEDVAGHADDRVKAFRADRGGKPGELDRAEKALATGRELLPLIEAFRTPDDRPLDSIRADLDGVESSIKRERGCPPLPRPARTWRTLWIRISSRVENDLAAVGFESDDEARSQSPRPRKTAGPVVYIPDPAESRTPPASSAATILFVSPIGPTRRAPATGIGEERSHPSSWRLPAASSTPSTRMAARSCGGAAGGHGYHGLPTVARVILPTGPTDIAVIASHVAGVSSVAAYVVRTAPCGTSRLAPNPKKPDEMLSVAAAGPPVVVGSRVFVPLRDEQARSSSLT